VRWATTSRKTAETVDWTEHRSGTFPRDPTERLGYRVAIERAVGGAFGLGITWVLAWSTGARGTVRLGTTGRRSGHWARTNLASVFPAGRWLTTPHGAQSGRDGTPIRRTAAGLSLPEWSAESGSPPWTDSLWPVVVGLPAGLEVRWTVTPARRPATSEPVARPPELERRSVPPGLRLAPLTLPERDLRDSLETTSLRARWLVRAEIRGSAPEAVVDALSDLLGAATMASRLGRLEFRRPTLGARFGSGLLAGDPEVAALFPTPWAALPWSDRGGRDTGPPVPLGKNRAGAVVALPWPAQEGRHLIVLGETGMGKSSLLVHLALEATRRMSSVVLLDPIGETAQALLDRLGPKTLSRTILVSPDSSPIPINALAPQSAGVADPAALDRTLGDVVTALRRVRAQRYPETSFWGPRIEETVRRALGAAAGWPRGTLCDAEALLTPGARGRILAPPEARAAVDELRAWVAERPEEIEGSRRLLAEVTRNRWLRRMLAEPAAKWSLARALEPGAVTVFSGAAARVGESTARYLLAVYLALLWPAVLARRQADKLVVVADEVEWYGHESLAEMLRLGRRYNLHVWAATQSLESLPETVGEAFRTNAADLVLFRGSPAEAREIGRWNPSVVPSELLALPRGYCLALIGKGQRVEAVEAATLPEGLETQARRDLLAGKVAEFASAETPETSPVVAYEERSRTGFSLAAGQEPTLATLLDLFAVASEPRPTGSELRVNLHRLREALPVSTSVVRQTGSELQRRGVLRGSGHDGSGSYWRVDREALRVTHPGPSDPVRVAELRAWWAAIEEP
jgi:Helicase HerA, central domain